jgi:hypothetical protein
MNVMLKLSGNGDSVLGLFVLYSFCSKASGCHNA